MARQLHGEITLYLYGKRYTLRPSLGALAAIERELDTTIPSLIDAINEHSVSPASIRFILHEGFKAYYGERQALPLLFDWQLRRLWPIALIFLIHGMGFLLIEPDKRHQELSPEAANHDGEAPVAQKIIAPGSVASAQTNGLKFNFKPLEWGSIYDSATMLLNVSQSEYWHMTMPELSRRAGVLARMHGINSGLPANHEDLDWMIAQFPDKAAV